MALTRMISGNDPLLKQRRWRALLTAAGCQAGRGGMSGSGADLGGSLAPELGV